MNRESITFLVTRLRAAFPPFSRHVTSSSYPLGGAGLLHSATSMYAFCVQDAPHIYHLVAHVSAGCTKPCRRLCYYDWSTPCGTRTRNLWIRGPTRYPLRQGGGNTQQEAAAAAAGDVELTGSRAAACVRSGWAPLCYLSLLGGQRWYRMGWLHRAPGLDGAVPMFCPSYSGVPTGG